MTFLLQFKKLPLIFLGLILWCMDAQAQQVYDTPPENVYIWVNVAHDNTPGPNEVTLRSAIADINSRPVANEVYWIFFEQHLFQSGIEIWSPITVEKFVNINKYNEAQEYTAVYDRLLNDDGEKIQFYGRGNFSNFFKFDINEDKVYAESIASNEHLYNYRLEINGVVFVGDEFDYYFNVRVIYGGNIIGNNGTTRNYLTILWCFGCEFRNPDYLSGNYFSKQGYKLDSDSEDRSFQCRLWNCLFEGVSFENKNYNRHEIAPYLSILNSEFYNGRDSYIDFTHNSSFVYVNVRGSYIEEYDHGNPAHIGNMDPFIEVNSSEHLELYAYGNEVLANDYSYIRVNDAGNTGRHWTYSNNLNYRYDNEKNFLLRNYETENEFGRIGHIEEVSFSSGQEELISIKVQDFGNYKHIEDMENALIVLYYSTTPNFENGRNVGRIGLSTFGDASLNYLGNGLNEYLIRNFRFPWSDYGYYRFQLRPFHPEPWSTNYTDLSDVVAIFPPCEDPTQQQSAINTLAPKANKYFDLTDLGTDLQVSAASNGLVYKNHNDVLWQAAFYHEVGGIAMPDWNNADAYYLGNSIPAGGVAAAPVNSFPKISQGFETGTAVAWRAGLVLPDGGIHWSNHEKLSFRPNKQAPIEVYLDNFTDIHSGKINWNYNASFYDEKVAEGLSYADGLGRTRQQQSKNQETGSIITQEMVYSPYSGDGVSSLAAPSGAGQFGYATHFFDVNDGGTTRDFAAQDFDVLHTDFTAGQYYYNPTPVDASIPNSVSNYYSNNSNEDWVDNAQGYPYSYNLTRVDGKPDRTSAGVGASFVLPERSIQHLYGNASPEEIHLIYGSGSNKEGTIKKNTTIDANGVGNISYVNQEGLVVATAIQQCSALENLVPLQPKADGAKVGAGEPFTQDYIENFENTLNPLAGNNDVVIESELANEVSATFTMPCSQNPLTDFHYDLLGELTTYEILEQCYVCGYTITIEVKNELTGVVVPELSYEYNINPEELACGDPLPDGLPLQKTEDLSLPGPATYVVTRRVEPFKTESGKETWEENYENWRQEFENNGAGKEDFREAYFSQETYFVVRQKLTDDYSPYTPSNKVCYEARTSLGNGLDCNRPGYFSDDETSLAAPIAVASTSFLNYFVLEQGSNTIRNVRFTFNGYLATNFAGTPCVANQVDGTTIDGGAFYDPVDMVLDPSNTDYLIVLEKSKVPNYPSFLRRVNVNTGEISSILVDNVLAFNAPESISIREDGTLYIANTGGNNVLKVTNLHASEAHVEQLNFSDVTVGGGIAVDETNNRLWISDRVHHKIFHYPLEGNGSIFEYGSGIAGFDDNTNGADATFNEPGRLLQHKNGLLFVSDAGNHALRTIDPVSGAVFTTLGTGAPGHVNGIGNNAQLNIPAGMVEVDLSGGIWLMDQGNNRIRSIIPADCPSSDEDCEATASCQEVVNYLDEVWLEKLKQDPLDNQHTITNLEGGYLTPTQSDDETLDVTVGTYTELTNTSPDWETIATLYERQFNAAPTILSLEEIEVTPSVMPLLLDEGELDLNETHPYKLYKAVINLGNCEDYCDVELANEQPADRSEFCETQFEALKFEEQRALEAVEANSATFTVSGQDYTLSQLIQLYTELPLDVLEILDDASFELYDSYMAARFELNSFSLQECLLGSAEEVDYCAECADEMFLELFSVASNITDNYAAFRFENPDLWNGSDNFPFTQDQIQEEHVDGNGNPYFLPAQSIIDQFGEYMAYYFFEYYSVISSYNTADEWEATLSASDLKAELLAVVNLPEHADVYSSCQSDIERIIEELSQDFDGVFPAGMLPYLLDELRAEGLTLKSAGLDGLVYTGLRQCIFAYTATLEDIAADARAACLEDADGDPDLVELCNSTPDEVYLNRLLEEIIVDEINSASFAYGVKIPADVHVDLIESITAELVLLDENNPEQHIFQIADVKLFFIVASEICKLDCEMDFESAYEEWVTDYVDNVKEQFETAYEGYCFSQLQEEFWLKYIDVPRHFTLYFYDEAQRLKMTVPPEGVDYVTPEEEPCHRMETTYEYEGEQVVEQRTPDGGTTRFIYDDDGRLRYSQSAAQRQESKDLGFLIFNYSKYDRNNRVVETGEYRDFEQQLAGWSQECPECGGPSALGFFFLDQMKNAGGFPFPGTGAVVDKVTITYDVSTYNFPRYPQHNTEGRVAAINNNSGSTHFSYDGKGRVKYVIHDVKDLDQFNVKWAEYKYAPLSGTVNEVVYMEGAPTEEFRHKFAYDANNKLVSVKVAEVINSPEDSILIAQYEYYDHGPLKSKILGDGTQKVDYVYNINGWLKAINNPADMQESGNIANDVFGELLVYHSGDYSRAGNNILDAQPQEDDYIRDLTQDGNADNLYNGNIAAVVYHNDFDRVSDQLAEGLNPFFNPEDLERLDYARSFANRNILTQGYQYDVLNRLMQAYTEEKQTASQAYTGPGLFSSPEESDFYSAYTYDANGNLTSLWRNFRRGTDFTYTWPFNAKQYNDNYQLDRLSYTYYNDLNDQRYGRAGTSDHPDYNDYEFCTDEGYLRTNRLNAVSEAPSAGKSSSDPSIEDQSSNNYKYDASGRLIQDLSEDIQEIKWNSFGKVKSITKGTDQNEETIAFTYNNTGKRQSKIVKNVVGDVVEKSVYVYGADNNLLATYKAEPKDGAPGFDYFRDDMPLYGSAREGIFSRRIEVVDNDIDDGLNIDVEEITSALLQSVEEELTERLEEISELVESSVDEVLTGVDGGVEQAGEAVVFGTKVVLETVNEVRTNAETAVLIAQKELRDLEERVREEVDNTEPPNVDPPNVEPPNEDEIRNEILTVYNRLNNDIKERVRVSESFESAFLGRVDIALRGGIDEQDVGLYTDYAALRYYHGMNSLTDHDNDVRFDEDVDGLVDDVLDNFGADVDLPPIALVEQAQALLQNDVLPALDYQIFDLQRALTSQLSLAAQSFPQIREIALNQQQARGGNTVTRGSLARDLAAAMLTHGANPVACDVPTVLEGDGLRVGVGQVLNHLNLKYLVEPQEEPLADGSLWNILNNGGVVDNLLNELNQLLGQDVAQETLPFLVVTGTDQCLQLTAQTKPLLEENLAGELENGSFSAEHNALQQWLHSHSNVSLADLKANERLLTQQYSMTLGDMVREANVTLAGLNGGGQVGASSNEEGPTEDFITYELTDHLGNVRATVNHVKTEQDQAYITSMHDYYPFGMPMPGRSFTSENYRFGFNGMEKDDEIKGVGNSLDYGARMYDARLGRWHSRDPLEVAYKSLSPYQFAANSPIYYKDIDGRKIVIYYEGGSYTVGSGKTVPKNDFVRATLKSLYLLSQVSEIQSELLELVDSDVLTININEVSGGSFFRGAIGGNKEFGHYTQDTQNLDWDVSQGVRPNSEKGNSLPPFAALGHELGHIYDLFRRTDYANGGKIDKAEWEGLEKQKDVVWQDAYEKYTIKNWEHPIANHYNLLVRQNYETDYMGVYDFESIIGESLLQFQQMPLMTPITTGRGSQDITILPSPKF